MTAEYDTYCNFSSAAAKAIAGANILLQVWQIVTSGETTTNTLLAIAGQQSLTINRSSDSIEVSSKDTTGNWKSSIPGMKEWSIDTDGVYVADDASHKYLTQCFTDGTLVCVKVINAKTSADLFGGVAAITDYTLEAPYDDAMTFSLSLNGNGALTDLSDTV